MPNRLLGAFLSAMIVSLGLGMAQGIGQFPQEVRGGSLPGPVDFLKPIGPQLSGRLWLLTQGLEPRLAAALAGEREGEGFRGEYQRAMGLFRAFTNPLLQAPGAAALVPYREPGPAFSRGVLVTRDLGDIPIQTEPHLAVNPKDPDHLVMGVIDYNMASLVSYVSQDGGASWEGPFQAPYLLDDLGTGGDPVLAFDRQGRLFMTGISIGLEEFTVGPFALFSLVSSMSVARSDDGGFSFPATYSSARSDVNTDKLSTDRQGRVRGEVSVGFLDKPWLAVGPNPKDPTKDIVYVVYTDFETVYEPLYVDEILTLSARETRTTIRLVKSEDGGMTWSKPLAISPTVRETYGEGDGNPGEGEALGTRRVVQGGNVAVGPDGSVYVAYFDSTNDESFKGQGEIYVARSTDGGATFSKPVVASSFNEVPFRPRTNNFRFWASSFPQMAIGPQGDVYIVYAARPSDKNADDGDIYLVRSQDGGKSFGRPRRLNADETSRTQFFPTIAVSPKGVIHVMWGDTRDDRAQLRYHIYYTRSEDRGENWGFEIKEQNLKSGDVRVTDFPSNPNKGFPGGQFIGDYFSIRATDEDVYMLWADSRLGEFGGFNQKIGFARLRPLRQPEIFASPSAGPGGQSVSLQGFNFQPDSTIFVLLGDGVIASTRSNLEGRFTTTFYMPVTGEGPQNLRVVDASGNLASGSFFTDFGFNNVQALLRQLQQAAPAAGNPANDPQLARLLSEIQKSQALYQQLLNQLAQIQKTNQELYNQLMKRLEALQKEVQKLQQSQPRR